MAKIFREWRYNEENGKATPVYESLGTFATKKEALQALAAANEKGFIPDRMRFSEVYERWSKEKYETITKDTADTYRAAYSAVPMLYDRDFAELKTADLEAAAQHQARTMKVVFKNLLGGMYRWAIRYDITDRDYSRVVDFHPDTETRMERKPIRPSEADRLRSVTGYNRLFADMALFGMATGFRPTEICEIELANIRDGIAIGGMKTENGRNRRVPLCADILPIVERNAAKSGKLSATRLFVDDNGKNVIYKRYDKHFRDILPGHTPHDTRHHFATRCRLCGIDPYIRDIIMGHSVKNLADRVYTHLDDAALKNAFKSFTP